MDVWGRYLQARVETTLHCLAGGLESRLGDSVVLCLEGECNGITDSSVLNPTCQSSTTIQRRRFTYDLVRGVSNHTGASNDNLVVYTFDGNDGQRYESGSYSECFEDHRE